MRVTAEHPCHPEDKKVLDAANQRRMEQAKEVELSQSLDTIGGVQKKIEELADQIKVLEREAQGLPQYEAITKTVRAESKQMELEALREKLEEMQQEVEDQVQDVMGA